MGAGARTTPRRAAPIEGRVTGPVLLFVVIGVPLVALVLALCNHPSPPVPEPEPTFFAPTIPPQQQVPFPGISFPPLPPVTLQPPPSFLVPITPTP
jgi:hypothetical protein